MELTTQDEKSLLLYMETQAVDYGGKLQSVRMRAADFALAKRWHDAGFVQFGLIANIKTTDGYARDLWCILSDEAWGIAHAERRARCELEMAKISVQRIGLDA